jgi:peptide/nickel transport system permease protein
VLIVGFVAIFAPALAPYPDHAGSKTNYDAIFHSPSREYPFGTDYIGRDMLSRIIMGARISLFIGISSMALAASIGIAVGLTAGYFGGRLDEFIMRVVEIFLAFPTLVLAILIASLWGRSLINLIIAVGLVWWPKYARFIRGLALGIKEKDFVEASRAVGANSMRIMLRTLLPNIFAPLSVRASLDIGYMILVAAALGFVGCGAQPPIPEWGLLVSIGRKYMPTYWWMSLFPGLAILITVLGFNLLGDGLRDILDPRTRYL